MTRPAPLDPTSARILRVLDHIHDQPASDLSLDRLAEVAALSRFHFHRMFRAVTGETVAQAVRRIRMNRAAHLLLADDTDIARIAAECGYPNPDSFTRAFAAQFGLRPAGFRARRRPHLTRSPDQPERKQDMSYPIEIRDEPAHRLAAIDHVGPYPGIARAFQSVAALLSTRKLVSEAGEMVGIYHDDPWTVPEAELRSSACAIVTETTEIAAPLVERRTEGGRHAVMTYRGPYSGLPNAYDWLYSDWLPTSGEEPADRPCWEKNLNSPQDTAPDDLITEIYLPLERA